MSGRVAIVGLGPGPARWMTPEASAEIETASDVVGYAPYVERLALRPDQRAHASDNRVELDRARLALTLAAEGHAVALVSGGDPGVFAMAAALFEAIEEKPEWRALDVSVAPGVTAMQAAAARLGAPLGHDFCAISLSDNLKPWAIVERRLKAAAEGDFVIALYNPASKAQALAHRRSLRPAAGAEGRGDTGRLRARDRARRRGLDADDARRGRPDPRRHGDPGHCRIERDAVRRARRRKGLDADAALLRERAMSPDPGHDRVQIIERLRLRRTSVAAP